MMTPFFERLAKVKQKVPLLMILSLLGIWFLYYFAYMVPFTNNAFVVANVRPVAGNVSGYITNIYVQNEEYVKKGQPLFTIFKKPYELAYQKSVADVGQAGAELAALYQQVEKTQHLVEAEQQVYDRINFNYTHYRVALNYHAVSNIQVDNMLKEKKAAFAKLQSVETELALEKQNILAKKMNILSLQAVMTNAKVNLDETTVYADNNGVVQNMYAALGSPIEIRKPIFSFVDTDHLAIQANFNETDLRNVKAGDKVTIIPRIYFWRKIYHGVIVSQNWSANRVVTDSRSQEQIVRNSEANWFLLPQRLPVQIRLLDYDPVHYPLSAGSSAYVYIHT